MSNPEEHRKLLIEFRERQTGDGWHTAPDDGYLYDNLVTLLQDAGLIDELKSLFSDPNWLHVRAKQGGYGSYLKDLQFVWDMSFQDALKQLEANEELTAFEDCVYYALIETSLRSWAESRTPSVVARAVEVGLWPPEQALSLAELIPDEQRRAETYAAIVKTGKLTSEQANSALTTAVESAKNIEYPFLRAGSLSSLSDQTKDDQQHDTLSGALEAALEAADYDFGGNGYDLWPLIGKLPDDLLKRAVSGTLALKNQDAKAWALAELAKRVPEEQRYGLLQQGLEAALQIQESDVVTANALARLTNQLSGDLVPRALDAALSLKEGDWRPRAVVGLMDKLDESQVDRVLENMLNIANEWWRADGLISVVERSSGKTQQRALRTLLSTQHGEAKEKIYDWLDYLDKPSLIETALDVAQELENPDQRAEAVKELNDLLVMMQEEDEFEDDDEEEVVPVGMPEVSESELEEVLAIRYEEDRSQSLAVIAGRLPESLLPRALEAALQIEETLYRDWALNGLAPRLSGDLLIDALGKRFNFDDTSALVDFLQRVASHIEPPLRRVALDYALKATLNIGNSWWRIDQLKNLLPDLVGDLANKAAIQLFEDSQKLKTNETTVRASALAIEYLEGDDRLRAINATLESVWNYGDRSDTFSALTQTNDEQYQDMGNWERIRALAPLLKHLDDEQKRIHLSKAVDMVLTIEDATWLSGSLSVIAPFLEGELLVQVVDFVFELDNEPTFAKAITSLADNLPDSYILRVLDRVQTIDDSGSRASVLIALAKRVDSDERTPILTQAYEATLAITHQWSRMRHLVELAELGFDLAAERGLEEIEAFSDTWEQTRILAMFLPSLTHQEDTRSKIRLGALQHLQTLRAGKREELFWYLCDENVFNEAVFPSELLTAFVSHTLNICQNWHWV